MRKNIAFILIVTLICQTFLIPVSVLAQAPTGSQVKPTTVSSTSTAVNYQYDTMGNLTFDQVRSITYDASGMPSSITKGNTAVNFIYDGSGQRIGKIVKEGGKLSSATIYMGSLEKEIKYNASGQVESTTITKYYFEGGKRIALRKVKAGQPDEIIYLHKDHLSSSTLFTDNTGNKKDSLITYFPYGNERLGWDLPSTPNPLPSNHLYTDQIKDPETSLYYYNARYYSPQTGIFLSPDTLGKDLNKYAYGNNNPVMFSDPSGHFPFLALIPLGALVLFMLTTPMACDTSVGEAQMTPEQSEFSVNLVKMMNPLFALPLSAAELHRGKKIGSDRPIYSNVEKTLLWGDVILSEFSLVDEAMGMVNSAIQTSKLKNVAGAKELLDASNYDEAVGVVSKYASDWKITTTVTDDPAIYGQGVVSYRAKHMRTWINKSTDQAAQADNLLTAEHEGSHILLDKAGGRYNAVDPYASNLSEEIMMASSFEFKNSPMTQQMGAALMYTARSYKHQQFWKIGSLFFNLNNFNNIGRSINYIFQDLRYSNQKKQYYEF